MSTPKSEKTMSSRLMNMKFMQRASASPGKATASSTESSPAKRRKVDGHTTSSSTDVHSAKQNEVPDAYEVKRLQALEKQGREFGETKWVLKRESKPILEDHSSRLQIRVAGYGLIDSDPQSERDDSEDSQTNPSTSFGRTSFGNFRSAGQNSSNTGVHENPSDDEESQNDSDAESTEDGDNVVSRSDPTESTSSSAQTVRERMKAKRKAQQAEALQLAERRRAKEVKLSKLSSISAQGRPSKSSSANIQCFKCGKMGHTKKLCPK